MTKVLWKKDWDYTVYEDGDTIYLEVLCGSSALFEVKVLLSDSDKENMQKDPEYLNNFAKKIRLNPRQYLDSWNRDCSSQ